MQKLCDYLKVSEAADYLGVSQNTLRSWAEAGKIPMHRNPANGFRLFLHKDLEDFLNRVAEKKPSAGQPGVGQEVAHLPGVHSHP